MQKTLQRISGLFCPQAFKNIQIDEIKIVLIKRTCRLAKTNLAYSTKVSRSILIFSLLLMFGCRAIILYLTMGDTLKTHISPIN